MWPQLEIRSFYQCDKGEEHDAIHTGLGWALNPMRVSLEKTGRKIWCGNRGRGYSGALTIQGTPRSAGSHQQLEESLPQSTWKGTVQTLGSHTAGLLNCGKISFCCFEPFCFDPSWLTQIFVWSGLFNTASFIVSQHQFPLTAICKSDDNVVHGCCSQSPGFFSYKVQISTLVGV
jgi:hypothetical protein